MKNLQNMKVIELKELAKEAKVSNWWTLKKVDLVKALEVNPISLELETIIQEEIEIEEALTESDIKEISPKLEEVKVPIIKKEPKEELHIIDVTGNEEVKIPIIKVEPIEDENLVTLKELIIEAGVKGTKARRLLRNANIERPSKRWEWDSIEHAHIIEQVKELLSK